MEIGGDGPRQSDINLGWVGANAGGGDDVAAEIDLGLRESALAHVGVEVVFSEDGENGGEVALVLFDSLGV